MHEHCYIYTCIPGQFVDLFGIVWDCISQFLLMVVISPSCFAVMLNKNMFEYASPLGTGCRFLRSLTFIGGGILTWGWLRSYHKQMEMWRWPSSEATDGLWIPTRNLDGFGVLLNRLHRWTATMSGFFFIRRSNRWFQHQWGVPRFFLVMSLDMADMDMAIVGVELLWVDIQPPTRRSPQSMMFWFAQQGDSCWWMLSLLTRRLKTKPPKNQPITENPSYILLFNG
jgi:hypothetical protein